MSVPEIFFLVMFLANPILGMIHQKYILNDYDKNKLPPSHDGPLQVRGQMNLRNIMDVSESKQLISLETTLTFIWQDTRIVPNQDKLDKKKDYMILSPKSEAIFWMPDVIIDQAKEIRKPKYLIEPVSIRLYNDSTIRYSRRMNYDVACRMSFRKFPFDNQTCRIIFHSFAHSTEEYQLTWSRVHKSYRNDKINLAQFNYEISYHDDYDIKDYEFVYPGLVAIITFDRIMSYHIIQTYIPSAFFVMVSYLTLFMPPNGLVARSGVPVIVLLTLFSMNNGIRANVPKVSYASLLDMWMVLCFLLVFLTLFEYCLMQLFMGVMKRIDIANRIEVTFRLLIPILFILFMIIYTSLFYWGNLDASTNPQNQEGFLRKHIQFQYSQF